VPILHNLRIVLPFRSHQDNLIKPYIGLIFGVILTLYPNIGLIMCILTPYPNRVKTYFPYQETYMLDFSVTNCLCHGHIVLFYKKSKLDNQNPLVIKLL